MKFTAQLSMSRLDLSSYRKALDKHMREALAQAIAVWLEAVLAEIPVWSGASRATFVKLASAINYSLPVGPATGNWAHGLFASRVDRTGMGIAASAGEVEANFDNRRYTFSYSTTLPWLIWNEYHNANVEPDPTLFYRVIKEGPYNFQAVGARVFLRFAEGVELPPITPHVRATRVKS
jgi:hypothetical protein